MTQGGGTRARREISETEQMCNVLLIGGAELKKRALGKESEEKKRRAPLLKTLRRLYECLLFLCLCV